MSSPAIALPCPRCGSELPPEAFAPAGASCPSCQTPVEAAAFPALFRAATASVYEPIVSGEAACFFHPDRIAVSSCARCGRFLCALCQIRWTAGEDVCTACLEIAGRSQSAALSPAPPASALLSSRFHYDSLALALATVPVLTWIFSMITAPLALGYALVTFRRQSSIVPRTKIRLLAAIFCSLLTIAGWAVFWTYVARRGIHSAPPPFP
ncbi:MAG: hypothetical protein JO340_19025 [Acidobacteriaceae bacterium]|nr:hypothetical protein [Acidobacteriaceae bacterium]